MICFILFENLKRIPLAKTSGTETNKFLRWDMSCPQLRPGLLLARKTLTFIAIRTIRMENGFEGSNAYTDRDMSMKLLRYCITL